MEAGEIQGRSEKVAAVLQSEMYHFHRERVIDFRQMMREMLQEQISFYKEVSARLLLFLSYVKLPMATLHKFSALLLIVNS